MNEDKARATLANRIDKARNKDCFDEPYLPEMTLAERDMIIAALRATPASFRRIYDKMQRGKVSADDGAKS